MLFVDLTPNTGLEHFGVVGFRLADFIVNYKNIGPGRAHFNAISFGYFFWRLFSAPKRALICGD